LKVSGDLTIQHPKIDNNFNTVSVGAGSLSCNALNLQGTTGTRYSILSVSTGEVTVKGNILSSGYCSQIIFSGTGILIAGGSFLSGTEGTFIPAKSTVIFNSKSAQTIAPFPYTFNNVTLLGSRKRH